MNGGAVMMRMLLEIVMVLGLMGGLMFVVKILAKEKRLNKPSPDDAETGQASEPDSRD